MPDWKKKTVETDTFGGFHELRQHQRVLVRRNDFPDSEPWPGIILSASAQLSLVRYTVDGELREERISNLRIIPMK